MRVPRATYRLQFNPAFGFAQAQHLVPYLTELGISDIYASPIFKARQGSAHGYDVVDLNQLNPELGTAEDFAALIQVLQSHNLGWVQDFVPNHMAFDGQNQMLMDVFENGSRSPYYTFFDVDWEHHYENIRGRLLAPILGQRYGESLEDGEITLGYDTDGFSINYYDKKFPLRLESYATIIAHQLGVLRARLGEEHIEYIKILGILHIIKNLPLCRDDDFMAGYAQTKIIKNMLWEVYSKNAIIKHFIDENVARFNGTRDNPESFGLLDDLLAQQVYRLAFWKVATEELNYRRFFSINDLISLRMEDQEVFDHNHALLFKLLAEGRITGVRIDHIDGLYNPPEYLERLRQRAADCYILVEKILALDEELPRSWPVQGTTGYDFLNYCNGLFCDRRHEARFDRLYPRFIGYEVPYGELVNAKKKLIIEKYMTGDVDNLAHLLKKISSKYRHGADISLYSFKKVVVELLSEFPVYRTYLTPAGGEERDYGYLKTAFRRGRKRNPDFISEFDFLEELLFGPEHGFDPEKQDFIHFMMRFQQLSGPLMAKGFEDTTLYVYNRLISLNEVGGDPKRFGISVREFHQYNLKKVMLWPHAMNASSTHDTKRGEDVRARINVLSEIPAEWGKNLNRWGKLNHKKKPVMGGKALPDPNDEYLLYQTLIGAFPYDDTQYPEFVERIKQYMIKAVREAKIHTGWIKPDVDYEAALLAFIDRVLAEPAQNPFLIEFIPFQKKVAHYGVFNSLSQALLKITAPGVPDFYQGTELWDLNLVDPDNRRPVDFAQRQQFLREIKAKEQEDRTALLGELLATKEDGRVKLFLIYQALKARERFPALFARGDYVPIKVTGPYKDHLVSFLRRHDHGTALIVVPRLLTALINEDEFPLGTKVWKDTALSLPYRSSFWHEVFSAHAIQSEGKLLVGELLSQFPVALCVGGPLRTRPAE